MQQDALFTEQLQSEKPSGPVTCLGKTFANDTERRAYFTELLAEKLKDPEFRKIDGFPIGSDEDILNLSDPPYYTACPNPFLRDMVKIEGNEYLPSVKYLKEPLSVDVKEGKNHAIYNAHTYHTKVPHRAIMRYMLHYTQPGDIVLDAFCGTGMTGVAAAACGDYKEVKELGFVVDGNDAFSSDGSRYHIGCRHAILTDLSPIASFISSNINYLPKPELLDSAASLILSGLSEVEHDLYSSSSNCGETRGIINYVIWSDVYVCQECSCEYDYWSQAVELGSGVANKTFSCPDCGAEQNTRHLKRAFETFYDPILNSNVTMCKQKPVYLSYFDVNGKKVKSNLNDSDIIKCNNTLSFDEVSGYISPVELPKGDRYKRDAFEGRGVTHIHHFYTWRNLKSIYLLIKAIDSSGFDYEIKRALLFVVTSFADRNGTKRNRFVINEHNPNGRVNGPMANTLYLPNLFCEMNVFELFREKLKDILSASEKRFTSGCSYVSTSSATNIPLSDNSVDYIFTDPPFGHNIQYSELNQPLESIFRIFSKSQNDIVVNEVAGKKDDFYRDNIRKAFNEYYRILKPGRWITIEFSNTQAGIWNSLQTALTESGFVIASVAALDKSRGGMHSMIGVTAVKQDLIITAYKPDSDFEQLILSKKGSQNSVWDFVNMHLNHLPVTKFSNSNLEFIIERDPRIIFDRMVAWFVQHNVLVPISSQDFHIGVSKRFVERDGMYFLDEQAVEYDKKKAVVGELVQISLFVKDEASAIQWIRQLLKLKPQITADITPQFMQQLSGWSKNEVQLDLRELLNQNFLCYDGKDDVPDQIHSYLSTNWKELRNLAKTAPELKAKAKDRWYVPDPNKAGDLEKLRERSLLKEFEEYKTAKKKLKVFRIEAVRAGFKKLWEAQEFASILEISTKLPNDVIAEDPILLMYFDQAMTLSQNNSNEDW